MIKLFFSYSHKDEELRNELETHLAPLKREGVIDVWHDRRIHLAPLKREGVIDVWHDRRISPGKHFGSEISKQLQESQIILLLVSAYFVESDYCYEAEMTRAFELQHTGRARVIPVILHPCDWHRLPFGNLQALPKDGKPISKYSNLHEAFLEVTQGIRAVAEEFEVAKPIETVKKPTTTDSTTPLLGNVRSSNLRVKRTFTQREKDKFERDAYEYVEKYFENSLSELQARNSNIETEYRRIDANHFTAKVYVKGAEASSCVIGSQGRGGFMGGITFGYGNSVGSGMNESLSVEDDGYTLHLKALGLREFLFG